jgi:hypothetical protein
MAHAMSYDSSRKRVVLFGGQALGGAAGLHDTWEWDGDSWTQMSDTGPSDRYGHAMAFDAGRSRTVLFGGANQAPAFATNGETWEWDGNEWVQRDDVGPTPRSGPAMTFDAVRGRVVLFGGEGTDLAALGDTWEWDGTTWSQKSDFGPTPLARATLSARGQGLAILFGGNPAPSAPPTEASSLTWEWDGTHWALRQHLGPTPRFGQAAAFDDARRRIVLSGGLVPTTGGASQIAGDTWEMFELAGGTPAPAGGGASSPTDGGTTAAAGGGASSPTDAGPIDSISVEPSTISEHGTVINIVVTIVLRGGRTETTAVEVVWTHPALLGSPNPVSVASLLIDTGLNTGTVHVPVDSIIPRLESSGIALPATVTISARYGPIISFASTRSTALQVAANPTPLPLGQT